MTTRTRKLIGTILLLLLVAAYVLVMMVVASAVLPNVGKAGELIFYAIAGFLWVPPAGLIISWMHR